MKKTISVLLALALMFSLCACGESSSAQYARSEDKSAAASGAIYTEAAAEEPMYAEDSVNGLSPATASVPAGGSTEVPSQRPDKIIYSANVQVETTDFDGTVNKVDEMVETYGGWVESSSIYGSNYAERSRGGVSRRSATYTLRIPSDRFPELMGNLSGLGNIPYSHVYTENVSAQYYDTQARLTALEAQEKRLLEMMEKAETMEDVILLEDRLTDVRYRIDSLHGQLNNWDRQVSYSTIYLEIVEVQEYSPEPQVQPSYAQQLRTALEDGLHSTGAFFKGFLLALVEALPTLLVLALVIGLPITLAVRRSKKRLAAKAAAAAPKEPPPAPAEEASEKESAP